MSSQLFRLPLLADPQNRDETVLRDAQLINGFVEVLEKEVWVFKRPGLSVYQTLAAATGLGVFNYQGDIYSVWNGNFYRNATLLNSTLDTTGGVYTFDSILGSTPVLFLHSTTAAYYYNPASGVFTNVPLTSTSTGTVTITLGSTAVDSHTTSVTSAWIGYGVSGPGIPSGTTIVGVIDTVRYTISALATASNTATPVIYTIPGFPASPVPGSGYLDGYVYIFTSSAAIRGSGFNDLSTWAPSNSILAQIETDGGKALAKQLVYIIALGEWSTEVFYDAGNAAGSPLAPVLGAMVNVGCKHGRTVRSIEGVLFWVGQTREGSVMVMMMDGLKARIISTPAVARLLQDAQWTGMVYSWSAMISGHKFYAVTVAASGLTLVYDMVTGQWSRWVGANSLYFPIVDSTYSSTGRPLLQHESNGKIYNLDSMTYVDDGVAIVMDLYTPNFDGGTKGRKVVKALDVVADQTNGSYLDVRVSDDDYQTWSNFRRIDLGTVRPRLLNCGTFRRRAWHFRHDAPVPLRIKAVDLLIDQGTV